MSNFNLTQLRHFKAVIECGTFASAAKKMNLTQPALSNSISTLEHNIGIELIDRNCRPIKLTSAGKNLAIRIDHLLASSRMLESEIKYLGQGLSGHLNIGMTAVSSASVGGQILGQCQKLLPRVKADVLVAHTRVLLEKLLNEELDIIVGDTRDLPSDASELDFVDLPPMDGAAFCRAGHPILDRKVDHLQDILNFRLAGTHFPEQLIENLLKQHNLHHRDQLKFSLESDYIPLLIDTVIESDLILLTTEACVKLHTNAGLLKRIPFDLGVKGIWKAVTLKNKVCHPAIPKLIDIINTIK